MRRNIFIASHFCVALFLAGCAKEQVLQPTIQTVTAGVVEQVRPDVAERYSASIEPFARVDLAFKSGGIVEKILEVRGADGRMRNVQAGDRVAKDTELAQVRPLDYQHRVQQAESQRAQAEALLGQSKAQLTQANANFSEAEIEFKRASNLYESASLVKPQFDQAKGRYDSMAAAVSAAQANVKVAEANIAGTQAGVSDANLSLSDTSLRAPFAGWIFARNIERGSLVGNATIGFSLMDTHLVKAVFAVPDSSLSIIHLGQKLQVLLDAPQREVTGVITSISPQADPKSRVFSVEVTIDNAREQVRPGMIGSLALAGVSDGKSRLVVPLSAVVRAPANSSGFAVFRLEERGGKSYAAAQVIEIGQTFGNAIEVTQGLQNGDKILVLGGSLVHDGQEVRVLP